MMISKKICRICLHSGELKPFLMESKLYHLFQKLIPTEPDLEEELPKHVCLTCTKELQNILNFFEKCKYSEKVLKSIIEKKNIKETNIRKLDQDVPKMCAENGVKEAFINLALENTNIKLGIDTIKLLPTVKIQIDSDSKLDAKVKNEHSYSKSILNAFVVTDKLYSCEYCNKTFKSLSDLEDHNTFPDKAIVINHCTAHGEQKKV
ncbi:hypothetical protein NQ317_011877 [Molorchus minor]|uniref:ZAD domain-containing protein n=1 Tax=Molorchus minor TaxID=1323400 RepID=A0ABQ9JU58_9CUCU|nr:hypothetical protein NQ317_011877 [Molorchus minor]